LGKGDKSKNFSYSGSVSEGIEAVMGQGSPMTFSVAAFQSLLSTFQGKKVAGGFSMTRPTPSGLGQWIQTTHGPLTPRHGSFIAAILVAEGYCTVSYRSNAVWLTFPQIDP
jgi:hypothetical protein